MFVYIYIYNTMLISGDVIASAIDVSTFAKRTAAVSGMLVFRISEVVNSLNTKRIPNRQLEA